LYSEDNDMPEFTVPLIVILAASAAGLAAMISKTRKTKGTWFSNPKNSGSGIWRPTYKLC
jgi:hypothetical protein